MISELILSLLKEELKVKILGENPFMSGERKNINILVCRGNENSAVADAKAAGITDIAQLADIEKLAYPHFLHVMAILFVLNVIIMLVIGKLRPRATAFELEYTEQVNIEPYKYLVPVGLSIVAIVIFTYFYFN